MTGSTDPRHRPHKHDHAQLSIPSAPGFRGHAPTVQQLAGSSAIPTAVTGGLGGGAGVIDVLARPARMTLGGQAQVLEKQGLRVADELREARQVRACMRGRGCVFDIDVCTYLRIYIHAHGGDGGDDRSGRGTTWTWCAT